MNTLSKVHYEPLKRERTRCPTILKCRLNGSIVIPAASTIIVTVSSLTLDTSNLCNCCIKLEFSSNIVFDAPTGVGTVTLTFQINKLCEDMVHKIPVGPSWTYTTTSVTTEGAVTNISIFSFFVYDCDLCSQGCCSYTVDVVPAVGNTIEASILSASFSAIATCSTNQC